MKKYTNLLLRSLFAAFFAAFLGTAATSFAQSELFGEAVNQDFLEKIQPGLLEQAGRPETSPYDFMLIAKRLGVYGDPSAAAAMGKWLGDPDKSHSARNALEEMPFDEALAELRTALGTVADPVLKSGVIDSLGMRRDKNAIDAILPLLTNENAQIANAALFALCRIADPSYRETLTGKLAQDDNDLNRKTADLLLMYGDFLRRDGKEADALAVFKAVIEKAPAGFYKESACYQILLRETDEARALAAEWLLGEDAIAFNATLRAAAFVKSDGVCETLIAAFDKISAERKPALIAALGDQKNLKAQGVLMTALTSDDEAVKSAAVSAFKAFSDPDIMLRLIDTALASNDESLIVKTVAVIERFDESVDPAILKLLDGDAAHQKIGVELVGLHKITEGRAPLLERAKNGPENVRSAALLAVGFIADNETLDFLADTYAQTSSEAALAGLYAACGTVPDKKAAAEKIAAVAESLTGKKEQKLAVFRAFTTLGGPAAREVVEKAAFSNDRDSQDVATQTLGAWMSPDAAPSLLKLAATPGYPYANRALRGALRLAKQFAMAEWLRRAIVRDALASPTCGAKEKEIADAIIQQYRLDMSVPETDEQKLLRNVEIIEAVYGLPEDSEKQKDVTAALRGHFAKQDSATINLGSYNAFFGGDPAPSVHKKLRLTIKYLDSGTVKTVDFSEGAAVALPKE